MNNDKISINEAGQLQVPDHVTLPFIIGDGIGPDIWRPLFRVFDAAIAKAYQRQKRKVNWKYWPVKKLLMKPAIGCLKKRYRYLGNI